MNGAEKIALDCTAVKLEKQLGQVEIVDEF